MLLSELYTPKQVLHYICPIALSLATDRVADVRIIAFKLVSTNNHSFIRATINSRSSGNVCNTRTIVVTLPGINFFRFNCTTREKVLCIYFFVIL